MSTLDSKTAPTIADHEAEQIDRANATFRDAVYELPSRAAASSPRALIPSLG